MNPLLNRLYQSKSRNKTRKLSTQRDVHNHSQQKVLVPKMSTRVKLESLYDLPSQRKVTNAPRLHIGKLPSIIQKTTEIDQKDALVPRHSFRNRKLSTSVRQDGNFFSTQLQDMAQLTQSVPIQRQETRPVISKTFAISKMQKQETQQEKEELFQYLRVLQQNQDLQQQFCYMNRKQPPYSFYIVDHQYRNPNQYLTVSLRGITHFKDGINEFYTVKTLSKQLQLYKKIKSIGFFKDYLINKVMLHWKNQMIRKKFKLKCKHLTTHLFSQNQRIQQYLHFLHDLAQNYSKGSFYSFNISITKTLQQFQSMAAESNSHIIGKVAKFDIIVQKKLKKTLQDMLTKFRSEERVRVGSAQKKRQDEAYLPFDSKKKTMKYTQMAKLKDFQIMMYRLIKYTDIIRFNVKAEMIRKCYENSITQLQSLIKLLQNREAMRYTNWMKVNVDMQQGGSLLISPKIQQIKKSVVSIKDNLLKQIFKNHFLLIQKKDQFWIENMQENQEDQHPSRFELKYHVLQNIEFQVLNKQLMQTLSDITERADEFLTNLTKRFASIYKNHRLDEKVQSYLTNQRLTQYLKTYRQEFDQVTKLEENAEFAIVAINIASLKQKMKIAIQQKFKIIVNGVPQEVNKRCTWLEIELRNFYSQFKQNPYTIQDYINFSFKFYRLKPKLSELQVYLQKLFEFEELVYKFNIRIGEPAKIRINQCDTLFKELTKRLQEIQSNQQKNKERFEKMVQNMIPLIEQKSQQLLKQISQDSILNSSASQTSKALKKMAQVCELFQKLHNKKKQLFTYQGKLHLGHKHMQSFENLQINAQYLSNIWQTRKNYDQTFKIVKEKGYGLISNIDISKLQNFIQNMDRYATVLRCYQLLHESKLQILKLLRIIKICRQLSSPNLQKTHIAQLRKIIMNSDKLKHQNIFTKDSMNTITCFTLFQQTNISDIQQQISDIVFMSTQESIVKDQLLDIQNYWKKTKVRFVIEQLADNDQPMMHLQLNQDLQQKLGYFIVTLKNIQGSPQMIGLLKQKAQDNYKICVYLRDLLIKWQQVQKQWIKLLPIMTNCPAVKHQSNVFFQYTAVDTAIKKLIKQVSQMGSLKKLCEDHLDKKYYNTLLNCQHELQNINKTFTTFLQNKRSTYSRLYFVSDLQLINILEHVKDARSASKYVSLCFNCKSILLDGQLMAGLKNQKDTLKLRKTIIRGETDQIFKTIQQNMKTSIKLQTKTLMPKVRAVDGLQDQIKDQPVQICLLVDLIIWTQMCQRYLQTTSYAQLQLVLKSIYQQVASLYQKASAQLWLKLNAKMVQMIYLKQIAQQLIRDQVTIHDFKWKQQIKFSQPQDDIIVSQFQSKLTYGCQYYPPSSTTIPTNNSLRFRIQTFYSCVNNKMMFVQGQQGQGKRHLIRQSASFMGQYQQEVICSHRLTQHYISKFVQGAVSAGVWITFYQFQHLNYTVCAQLLHLISKANSLQYRLQPYLFIMSSHAQKVQQISIYSFNSFVIYEPQKDKICQYLIKSYRFDQWQQLSQRLIAFFRQIKPFLDPIMGSQLTLIKKVVQKAGNIYLHTQQRINQIQLFGKIIIDQVINKQKSTKSSILFKALSCYFGLQQAVLPSKVTYQQKTQSLMQMIKQQVQNIIVLGERSCKTAMIRQSLVKLDKKYVNFYAQTTQNFFSSATMQFIGDLQEDTVIVYDANQVIGEWADFITSGYLFLQGKKVVLYNHLIMQLRSISQCTPSFVGKCHIIYIDSSIIGKVQTLRSYFSNKNANKDTVTQVAKQLFGDSLENITLQQIHILGLLFQKSTEILTPVNTHKSIIWLMSIMGKSQLWNRNYGGNIELFCFNPETAQVQALDQLKYESIAHQTKTQYLITPTRSTSVLIDTSLLLTKYGISVHLQGPQQSGKTSLFSLLGKRFRLNINQSTQKWSQKIKKKFTFVRKEGKYILIELKEQNNIFIIDDLDIGKPYQSEYLRVLQESHSFRDKNFHQFAFPNLRFITSSRPFAHNGKFWSNKATLYLKDWSRDDLQTVYKVNYGRRTSQYSMTRQLQQYIQQKITKAVLIAFDDISIVINPNKTASMLMGLLRNLLSLSKRQSHFGVKHYYRFFKQHFHDKLREQKTNGRLQYQLGQIQQNILKVIFEDTIVNPGSYFINLQDQYKDYPVQEINKIVTDINPTVMHFPNFMDNLVYFLNQSTTCDHHFFFQARKGTGRKLLASLGSDLMNFPIVDDPSDTILKAIRNQKVIFVDDLENGQTFYQQLMSSQSDKDLQRLIKVQKREQFFSKVVGQEITKNKLLKKCKQMIVHVFLAQTQDTINLFCQKRRQLSGIPKCLIGQWPAQALISKYNIKDKDPKIHAQLFTAINNALFKAGQHRYTLKMFEKYISFYDDIYSRLQAQLDAKIDLHSQIHFKFNESCEMITAWQTRIQTLRAQILKSIKVSKQTIIINQMNNYALQILHKRAKKRQQESAQHTKQLQMIDVQVQKKITFMKKVMNKIQKIVISFQRAQLGQLKKIFKLNRFVHFGVQCLCILLGQEQVDQKTINRILADSNLLMKMKSPQLLTNRNRRLENAFKKQYSTFQSDLRDNSNQLSKTLIQWIKSYLEYWQTTEELALQRQKQAKLKANIAVAKLLHEQFLYKVKEIQKQIQETQMVIAYHQSHKEELQIELNSFKQRMINAQKIIPVLRKQQQQTKIILQELNQSKDRLRGNTILVSVVVTLLPLLPLLLKQKIIELAKSILRKQLIFYTQEFMAQISSKPINSLQNLNFFIIQFSSYPKIVVDRHRKFLPYVQLTSTSQMREKIIQNAQDISKYQQGKIYHTAFEFKGDNERVLVIDWSTLALEQKQTIFLKLAQAKRPQYFVTKNDLQIKINRNLKKVKLMKQQLYKAICQRNVKIIQDDKFVQNAQELTKLRAQTLTLQRQTDNKKASIKILTQQINEQVTSIIQIYEIISQYRKVQLQLITHVSCSASNSLQILIRWCLQNIKETQRIAFLMEVVVTLRKEQHLLPLLKGIISQTSLRLSQSRVKKPMVVGNNNWDLINRLSLYSSNMSKIDEDVLKYPKQFETWCQDPLTIQLPSGFPQLGFLQYVALLTYIKPKTSSYLISQLISKHLPFNLTPLPVRDVISIAQPKFPIIIRAPLSQIKKMAGQLNGNKVTSVRVSKIVNEAQMKRVVWRSMQHKQWLICEGVQTVKDLKRLQEICYYVLNYDKQQGFRIIICLDECLGVSLQSSKDTTKRQDLLKSSIFLDSNSIQIFQKEVSYDRIYAQYSILQYQAGQAKGPSQTNKQYFNKLLKCSAICYTTLAQKYPVLLKFSYKRIAQLLQVIKNKNIPVEFNVASIVQYIGKMFSSVASTSQQRSQIQQLWQYIVDQNKFKKDTILGIKIDQQKLDRYVLGNLTLMGCQQSYLIRKANHIIQQAYEQLIHVSQLKPTQEEILGSLRTQLTRIPILISGKDMQNIYQYFYDQQVRAHNHTIRQLTRILEELSNQHHVQKMRKKGNLFQNICQSMTILIKQRVSISNIRAKVNTFVTKIRKQHDFLLYFKPNNNLIVLQSSLVKNLNVLVSTYFISRLQSLTQPWKLLPYLKLTQIQKQSDLKAQQGFFLSNLNCQQFTYNAARKDIDANLQLDGILPASLVQIVMSPDKIVQDESVQGIQIRICEKGVVKFQGFLQYNSVFKQWALRDTMFSS